MSDETYRAALLAMVESAAFEDCEECGDGLSGHVIAPDMFGNPHAWCAGTFEGVGNE
jgi:hypothetical protein